MLRALKGANLGLAFFLELCALAAFALWGYGVGRGGAIGVALALALPTLGAFAWGLFVAPKAFRPVPPPVRALLRIAFFGLAVAALTANGEPRAALAFGAAVALNLALGAWWGQG